MPRAPGPRPPAPSVVEPQILTREQQIYADRLAGFSVLAIADKYRTDVPEVERIVSQMCPSISMQMKLATIELELARLDEITNAFHARAKAGDAPSAAIMLRVSDARRSLLGLDSPLRVDAVQVRAEAGPGPTSIDKISAVIERIARSGRPSGELSGNNEQSNGNGALSGPLQLENT